MVPAAMAASKTPLTIHLACFHDQPTAAGKQHLERSAHGIRASDYRDPAVDQLLAADEKNAHSTRLEESA